MNILRKQKYLSLPYMESRGKFRKEKPLLPLRES